jgi:Uma2 family endonuclease
VAADLATYPDVTVIRGPAEEDAASRHVVLNPTLVVEVTSPSTEDWDRDDKLESYKAIPSLRAVLLLSHREPRIDVFERESDGRWTTRVVRSGTAALGDPRCALAIEEVYGTSSSDVRSR